MKTKIRNQRSEIRRLASLLICVHLCSSAVDSPAADLLVNARDFQRLPTAGRRVTLTPKAAQRIDAENLALVHREAISRFTGTNGATTFTNVLAGSYTLTLQGLPDTTYPINIPETNITLNAAALVPVSTNAVPGNGTYTYSAGSIDAKIAALTNLTIFTTNATSSVFTPDTDGDLTPSTTTDSDTYWQTVDGNLTPK